MTVQDFIDAYEKTELQPLQGDWISGNCACPIATLLVAKYGKAEAIRYLYYIYKTESYEGFKIKLNTEVGINITTFIKGWEGRDGEGEDYLLGKELREYYHDCTRTY